MSGTVAEQAASFGLAVVYEVQSIPPNENCNQVFRLNLCIPCRIKYHSKLKKRGGRSLITLPERERPWIEEPHDSLPKGVPAFGWTARRGLTWPY